MSWHLIMIVTVVWYFWTVLYWEPRERGKLRQKQKKHAMAIIDRYFAKDGYERNPAD
jgi:hypothetical protein